MRILGIDPGTATTGFAIIDVEGNNTKILDYGCIKTSAKLPAQERLQQIATDIKTLVKSWKPQEAALEEIFFAKNVKTAISVAQARGVIMQTLTDHKVPSGEYTPPQVKTAVCGDGKADKRQIQKMLQMIFDMKSPPKPDDAADAIAIAMCHAQHRAFYEKLEQKLK